MSAPVVEEVRTSLPVEAVPLPDASFLQGVTLDAATVGSPGAWHVIAHDPTAGKYKAVDVDTIISGTYVDATGDTMTGDLTMAADILPDAASTRSLGASGTEWANVYADALYGTLQTAAQPNVTSLGTLTDLTVSGAATFSDATGIKTDTVTERMAGSGVTVDGLLIKDSGIPQAAVTAHEAALTILESQITDGAVLARVGGTETITGAWTFSNGVAVTGGTLDVDVAADFAGAITLAAGSVLTWGGDTNLYRAAANTLRTDGAVMIDGGTDAIQLTVQAHSTQTAEVFVIENSLGTNLLEFSSSGHLTLVGALRLAYNQYIQWQDSGGTYRYILRMGAGDDFVIDNPAAGDVRVLTKLWIGDPKDVSLERRGGPNRLYTPNVLEVDSRLILGHSSQIKITDGVGTEHHFMNYTGGDHLRIDDGALGVEFAGDVVIGGTTAHYPGGSNRGKAIAFLTGANDPTVAADTVIFYAKDVAASAEGFVRDEAGNVTQLSPHDPKTGEWIFDSVNTRTGRHLRVRVERLLERLIDEVGLNRSEFILEEAIAA